MHSSQCLSGGILQDSSFLVVGIGAMILEGRGLPRSSKCTKTTFTPTQGPHSVEFLKHFGVSDTTITSHECDPNDFNCARFLNFSQRIIEIWNKNSKVIIEVLMVPQCATSNQPGKHMGSILLERWTLTVDGLCLNQCSTITVNALCAAINSRLYFSQISAWRSSDEPCTETVNYDFNFECFEFIETLSKHLNVMYRVREIDENEVFSRSNQIVHTFNAVNLGTNLYLNVTYLSYRRVQKIPAIICKDCSKPEADVVSDSSCEILKNCDVLVDDCMNFTCQNIAKHNCALKNEDVSNKSTDSRSINSLFNYCYQQGFMQLQVRNNNLKREREQHRLEISSTVDNSVPSETTNSKIKRVEISQPLLCEIENEYNSLNIMNYPLEINKIEDASIKTCNTSSHCLSGHIYNKEFIYTKTTSTQTDDKCLCGKDLEYSCIDCVANGDCVKPAEKSTCVTNLNTINKSDLLLQAMYRTCKNHQLASVNKSDRSNFNKSMANCDKKRCDNVIDIEISENTQSNKSVVLSNNNILSKNLNFPRKINMILESTKLNHLVDKLNINCDTSINKSDSPKEKVDSHKEVSELCCLSQKSSFSDDYDSDTTISSKSPISQHLLGANKLCHSRIRSRKPNKWYGPLLGNIEESLLQGRVPPETIISGYTARIGASGNGGDLVCIKQLVLPVSVNLHVLDGGHIMATPYTGRIELVKNGYNVPRSGSIQVTLLNPLGTVVHIFVVPYDLVDMPPYCHTFLRQRTVTVNGTLNINSLNSKLPESPSIEKTLLSSTKCSNTNIQENTDTDNSNRCNSKTKFNSDPKRKQQGSSNLRYVIHLRFQTSRSGRLSLYSDIDILVWLRSDLDTAVAHANSISFPEMQSIMIYPNPRYATREKNIH